MKANRKGIATMTMKLSCVGALLIIASAFTARAQEAQPSPWPVNGPNAQQTPAPIAPASDREAVCNDRRDDDGDGMVDCSDADCFHESVCESGHANENTNDRCSDWIDNDGDGFIDCDDSDCEGNGVTRCGGSGDAAASTTRNTSGELPAASSSTESESDSIPDLAADQQIEDLLGRGGDADGERTDEVCADGIDNDNDGRKDCQDFGCRFDPSVTVCSNAPGLRFNAAVFGGLQFNMSEAGNGSKPTPTLDASFSRIQLRALGTMPFIPGSFFMLSARAERDIRLTFMMFQLPIGGGHYVNLNSGGGSLAVQRIQSIARNPFGEAPAFAYNFAEQYAGLSLEFGGPLTSNGWLRYRAFGAVGAGTRGGSVGGEFFKFTGGNTTFGVGAQLQFNAIGRYDRFTSPMLYTPVPTTLAFYVGGRFDQRPSERYAAANALAVFRYGPLHLSVEAYGKREFVYQQWQGSYIANANVLIVPRRLLLSAEFAQFMGGNPAIDVVDGLSGTTVGLTDQWQARGAVHTYIFRNIFLLSLLFTENHKSKNLTHLSDNIMERTIELEARFMF